VHGVRGVLQILTIAATAAGAGSHGCPNDAAAARFKNLDVNVNHYTSTVSDKLWVCASMVRFVAHILIVRVSTQAKSPL